MSFFDMNKLRKRRSSTPDTSSQLPRTQSPSSYGQITLSPTKTPRSANTSQVVDLRTRIQPSASLPPSPSPVRTVLKPRSAAEQYWAARALTAETLLSARATHHKELKNLAYSEELKRARDLAALAKASDEKQAKLEKVVIALISLLFACLLLLIYQLAHTSRNTSTASRSASHFTIPILSPFASVVEQETSVIGTRTIVLSIMVLCALAYAVFRHWYSAFLRRSGG